MRASNMRGLNSMDSLLFPRCFVLPTLAAAALSTIAFAQTDPSRLNEGITRPGMPDASEVNELSALGLDEQNAFAPETPGDSDIGQQLILKETPKNRWLRGYADIFGYWTDNAANASEAEEDDWFWGARIGLGAQPRLANRLFADVDIHQQLFRYDKLDVLDYESMDASGALIYVEPKLANSLFFVQYNYNRITNDEFSEDLLNSHSIKAGVQKSFLLDRRNSIGVTLLGDWDVETDVAELDRNEYVADLSWRFKIMRDLVFGLSYRYSWLDYQQVDREDSLHIGAASLTWSPLKWMDIYASASLNLNESDADVFDYQSNNLGGGLGVKVRF